MLTKSILSTFVCCLISLTFLTAQTTDRVKNRAKNRTNQQIDRKVDQAVDGAVRKIEGLFKKKNKQAEEAPAPAEESTVDPNAVPTSTSSGEEEVNTEESPKSFTAYSKFDFLPGNEVIAFDDFSSTEPGDFPIQWNTNTGTEIVEFEELEGHWFKLHNLKGNFIPEYITELPENFTLEFDLIADFDGNYAYNRYLPILFTEVDDPSSRIASEYTGRNGFFVTLDGGLGGNDGQVKWSQIKDNSKSDITGKRPTPQHLNGGLGDKVTRVSIWRQKTRVRMYLDEQKVVDLPRAIASDANLNQIRFFSSMTNENDNIYFSNLRFAVGKPDARHALIETGRWVTRGITFDSNSATLQPESHGTLKAAAKVINDNPDMSIQIIGHTDGDGPADYNLTLSEERANAVKTALTEHFGVDGSRLTVEGKGETDPVSDNDTPEGKANNRRVEFVKM